VARVTFGALTPTTLLIRFQGALSDDECLAYLAGMRAELHGPKRVWLFDARLLTSATIRQRCMQGEWMDTNRALLNAHCARAAFVIDSAIVRGIFTAVLWISPMSVPYEIFATFDKAMSYCRTFSAPTSLAA
jgi:hypothetical protein